MAEYIVNINEEEVGEFDFIAVESLTKGTPLIRCRECRFRYTDGENVTANYCLLNHARVQEDDWFCADAERKEE